MRGHSAFPQRVRDAHQEAGDASPASSARRAPGADPRGRGAQVHEEIECIHMYVYIYIYVTVGNLNNISSSGVVADIGKRGGKVTVCLLKI